MDNLRFAIHRPLNQREMSILQEHIEHNNSLFKELLLANPNCTANQLAKEINKITIDTTCILSVLSLLLQRAYNEQPMPWE